MTSSKERVKSVFSGRSAEWAGWYADHELKTLEAQNLISRQQHAVDMVASVVPWASTVLDVGCGTGETAAKLMGLGYVVWGVDIAEPMISVARKHLRADRFQVGDIENLPFRDKAFDAAVCLGVIEYQDTDEQTLHEIRRVLKPGGRAVLSTPSAISPLYHMDRMALSLEAAARPLYYFVKYRLRGVPAPIRLPSADVSGRKYRRREWLRLLRSVGLEPEEWICHGWGWYSSRLAGLAMSLLQDGKVVRRALERLVGQKTASRVSKKFVRSLTLNWLASVQLVRVRSIPNHRLSVVACLMAHSV